MMQAEASYNVIYMYIFENVPLSSLSTMRLGGITKYMCNIEDKDDLVEAHKWSKEKNLPLKLIGDGSNIIWSDNGFKGLIAVNKIKGYSVFEVDDENVYITVGSGENWDKVVEKSVEQGYSGIESLSLIPGTTGATPIQNVGAYGTEIKDVLATLQAFDRDKEEFITMRGSECNFSYRNSRFKNEDKDRFLITSITMSLTKNKPKPPFYSAVEKYFIDKQVSDYTAKEVRKAVVDIRTQKLPDPIKVANCGSFFQNPIVNSEKAMGILNRYPDMPHWQLEDGTIKLSAAWLIENSGFKKGYHDQETGMGLWKNQALVIINETASKTSDLLNFKEKLTTQVLYNFGIELKQEPELA
jgi:UDP-N-acetylmuramate dehydrogenase